MARTRRSITQKQLEEMLEKRDGDFSTCELDFDVVISDKVIDFDLNFRDSVFNGNFIFINNTAEKNVDFSSTHFNGKVSLAGSHFKDDVNFKYSIIKGRLTTHRAIFYGRAFFSYVRFWGEVFITNAQFRKDVFFRKTRFKSELLVTKSSFAKRADFSYAQFSDLHVTSFLGIKNYKNEDGDLIKYAPKFIFRNLFFGHKTIFTEVNLAEAIFDTCVIEPVKFKNCKFSEKDGRKCFYEDVASTFHMKINKDAFHSIKSGEQTIDFRLNDLKRQDISVGDRINFVNQNKPSETYSVLVVGRHEEENFEKLFIDMHNVYSKLDYEQIRMFLSKIYSKEREHKEGVLALEFKNFSEKAKYENLVDINRQMKKSLEDSKDWQTAGDFYRGEMEANIELLRISKQKAIYRNTLRFYNLISGFAEDTSRILNVMAISFIAFAMMLWHFNPEASLSRVLELTMYFLVPIFGSRGVYVKDLGMDSGQTLAVLVLGTWFYLLWTVLAINLFRRFKR